MILSAGGFGGGRALVLGIAPHWKMGTAADAGSAALAVSAADMSLLLTKSTSTGYLPGPSGSGAVFKSLPLNDSVVVPLTSSCTAAAVPSLMPSVKTYEPEAGTSM